MTGFKALPVRTVVAVMDSFRTLSTHHHHQGSRGTCIGRHPVPASESNLKSQELLLGAFQTTNRPFLLKKRGFRLPFGKKPGTQSTRVQSMGQKIAKLRSFPRLARNPKGSVPCGPVDCDEPCLCAVLRFEPPFGSSPNASIPCATHVRPRASMGVNEHGWAGSAHGSRGGPKKGHPKGPRSGLLQSPVALANWWCQWEFCSGDRGVHVLTG